MLTQRTGKLQQNGIKNIQVSQRPVEETSAAICEGENILQPRFQVGTHRWLEVDYRRYLSGALKVE